MIADSNHGFKMIGVGELVADELLGDKSALLDAVSLLALRGRQAAPGVEQPVSVELTGQAPVQGAELDDFLRRASPSTPIASSTRR